jgi:hypothetical protein
MILIVRGHISSEEAIALAAVEAFATEGLRPNTGQPLSHASELFAWSPQQARNAVVALFTCAPSSPKFAIKSEHGDLQSPNS